MRRLTNDTILKLSSAINISSGAAKLFSLAMIQQKSNPYVRDDTIFIKIMVDVGDMSKAPMYIQQLLINKEQEALFSQQSIETDRDHDNSNSRQSST
ncbi:unnamed protein product [Rotaria magnacalcarata]|uniref:Uncharacterized protein n=1 Tax=Rotaria magnacalcarata TaxID=392030 RepID=A0A8S3AHZ4_9BILA|nr:unnamed protein product [Rotaria magnacalcarata]